MVSMKEFEKLQVDDLITGRPMLRMAGPDATTDFRVTAVHTDEGGKTCFVELAGAFMGVSIGEYGLEKVKDKKGKWTVDFFEIVDEVAGNG